MNTNQFEEFIEDGPLNDPPLVDSAGHLLEIHRLSEHSLGWIFPR